MKIKLKLTRPENLAHFGVTAGTLIALDMETQYLPVCVSSEVYEGNGRTPMEAKKAQAVAARTYVAAHALAGTVIDDTAGYQAYKWKDISAIPNSLQACRETAGQVLLYDGKLITAWYSNSNGGHTRRSDEAWSSYKPWTISQADPWDVAGRAKWGQVKASHGVGMSQTGAAYAASIGAGYGDILRFYYPGAALAGEYGAGKPIAGIPAAETEGEPMREYPITQDFHTKNDCYQNARVREKTHIIVHSTATAKNGSLSYRGRWYKWNKPDFKKCAHAFIDWEGIFQTLPWDYQGWLNGIASGNDCSIAFEICEPSAKDDTPQMAADLYGKTLYLCAYLCREHGISPQNVLCHAEAHKLGLANNHADVNHWWGKKGTSWEPYTMTRLRREIADALSVGEIFPYPAMVQTKTGGPISLWSVPGKNAKGRARVGGRYIPSGSLVQVLGHAELADWYVAAFDGLTGNADGEYLRRIDENLPPEDEAPPVVSEDDDNESLAENSRAYILTVDACQGSPLSGEQAAGLCDRLMADGYSAQARAVQ